MWKTSVIAVLITLSLWLAGCSGGMGIQWGPEGTQYDMNSAPAARRPRPAPRPAAGPLVAQDSFWHDLNLN